MKTAVAIRHLAFEDLGLIEPWLQRRGWLTVTYDAGVDDLSQIDLAQVDLLVLVSDNESWRDTRSGGATETMRQWEKIKARCPQAKLVCIDLQPVATSQTVERNDVLHVGGFRQRRAPPQKGGDIAYQLTVPFVDAVKLEPQRISLADGKTIDLKLPKGLQDGTKIPMDDILDMTGALFSPLE